MKANPFNICPTCEHQMTCVLTVQKSQVWSCSEYDELVPEPIFLSQMVPHFSPKTDQNFQEYKRTKIAL